MFAGMLGYCTIVLLITNLRFQQFVCIAAYFLVVNLVGLSDFFLNLYFRASVFRRQIELIMKTKIFKIILALVAGLFLSAASLSAATITVGASGTGAQYTNLQTAINNAPVGDTIKLLSDVTINEQISFARKLTLVSDNGYSVKKGELLWGILSGFICIYINSDLELINVHLDSDKHTSVAPWGDYSSYVTVTGGAVLRMDSRSSIRKSSDGAALTVNGTVIGGNITGNTSSSTNVGVVLVNSGGVMVNMVVDSNTLSKANVAAVNLNGGRMINCTVTNNKSGNSTNRYAVNSSNPGNEISNCIIYDNGAGILGQAKVAYSCIQGGYAGTGNISVNPELNANFSLKSTSPCIDKGNNGAVPGAATQDYFYNPRITNGRVDMGASEYLKRYCEKEDIRVSCGEPLVWIDGKSYTADNNTAMDTIPGSDCDTIVTLNFKYYKAVDKSSLTTDDLQVKDCPGSNVNFSCGWAVNGRTNYQWLDEDKQVLSTSASLSTKVDYVDRSYMFIASAADDACADTTIFTTLTDDHFVVNDPSALSLDSAANKGCLLASLDLTTILPTASFCAGYEGGDTTYYYSLNGGAWTKMVYSKLSDVANGTEILWKMEVRSANGYTLSGETSRPVVVHVSDKEAPTLLCDQILADQRVLPVSDSVNGVVPGTIRVTDILSAASDNCSSSLDVLVSLDGSEFFPFADVDTSLNVFNHTSQTIYWQVKDAVGLTSSVCVTQFEIERATEVDGTLYAIVRDTLVCSLPLTWHGHQFTHDGEVAEIGAARLTVKVDSSFFVSDTIIHEGPYTWRNGVTYAESIEIAEYRKPNVGACDSVYSLHLTITDASDLKIGAPVTPIETYADHGCALSDLDLAKLAPSFVFKGENGLDTTLYYQRDGGAWISLKEAAHLTDVVDGTSLLWRVSVTTSDDGVLSTETTVPQVIQVSDTVRPTLLCDKISENHRFISVSDSVNGVVKDEITLSEVMAAANDNCGDMTLWASSDGVDFSEFTSANLSLNVFTQPSAALYWKVKDESGNESSVCSVEYEVERETLVNEKKYAIVRDTFVCEDAFPVMWHGHSFVAADESAEIGAALLTVRVDSSGYRYDTLVVCGKTYYKVNGVNYARGTHDISYRVSNGPDQCDSVIYLHLTVVPPANKTIADTVWSSGCKMERVTLGFNNTSGAHTLHKWYIQGVLQTEEPWVSQTRVRDYYTGYDNYEYMLIRTTPEGYCPDTTVYITNSIHSIESGNVSPMVLIADDNCKATIRLRDYMPGFRDVCSNEVSDTVCQYNVNRSGEHYAGADDYYTFEDGDTISWAVGVYGADGLPYTVSNPYMTQRVTVVDTTAPKIDELGISYQNRSKGVADSVVGNVTLNIPLSDVTDHVSDNCTEVADLKIQYSFDNLVFHDFAGMDLLMNVYDEPTKVVYYSIADKRGNTTVSAVEYRIERKSFVGEDSFAVIRDTMVCPSKMPYVWHGATFKESGSVNVVGAAHLTVNVWEGYEKTDTIIVCESLVWRDGNEYTVSTNTPTFIKSNGGGECDSLIHLNLTVLNPSSGSDSIVVCVKELPYDWNGHMIKGDSTLTLRDVYGCDSLVDVKVIILPVATETIYDTACVSYTLNDSVYTKSGVYEQVLTSNVTGCDSILTLHLVINDVVKADMYKTVCGSFTLNDSVYTESGVYEQKLVSNVTGCDSILTLHLTVKPISEGKDTVYTCEGGFPVLWHNRYLMGDSLVTFMNQWGCDSVVAVKVIEIKIDTVEITETACGSYYLNDIKYDHSGDYIQRLTSSMGCDSIVRLHLTLLDAIEPTVIYDTVCGTYTLNDSVYAESGRYEQVLKSATGCDSMVILHLEVLPNLEYAFEDSVRGAYHWNDSIYTKSGVYTQKFTSKAGCDSVVTLSLKILESPRVIVEDTVCSGQGVMWNGVLVKEAGVYPKTEPTVFGDDSTTILHLTVLPTSSHTIYDTAYVSYTLNDSVYTKSGIYQQKLVAANGCDSILILNLKIKDVPRGYITRSECGSFSLNDSLYTESGRYEQLLKRADGSDSILTLDLTIWPTYDIVWKDTICGSTTWNGETYDASGSYTQQLSTAHGCDSIVTLDLVVLDIPVTQITDTVCGSYVLNDSTYTKSGHYTQRIPREDGCDSLVSLNLTILKSPLTLIQDTVCISYKLNDSIYTKSGVYDQHFTAKNGCDSIVRLELVVLNSPSTIYYDTACVSYSANGQTFTESTVFDKRINLPNGCDSVVTVHLTILPIKYDTVHVTSCGTYTLNDSVYTESGKYEQTLTSSIGCDSILTIYLDILEPTYGKDTVTMCENAAYVFWHDYKVGSDTTLTIKNAMGCDSIVDIIIERLPVRRSEVSDTSCAPYYWHGREYLVSGDFNFDTISSIGCDSVETLHLTILPSYEIFMQDSAVSYYEWNGVRYDSTGIYTQRFTSSLGCDSVVTKMISILEPPANAPVKVKSCISYMWQGRELTESGIYYDILKNAAGEDSIIAIDLTIHQPKVNPDTIHISVCENELPVMWNGFEVKNEYSRVILTTTEGCDSFVNIRLHVLPVYDTTEYETACDSFVWHGKTFYKSGLYHDTLQSVNGCDSTFSLSLTVKHSVITEIERTVCESELPIRWNEYEFYSDTIIKFPCSNGCDSIIKVSLTVNKEYNLVFDEVACSDFYWQGKLLTLSGTYVDSFTTQAGCDSIVTLNLIVSHPYRVDLADTTIAGSVYEKNGFTVDAQTIGQYEYEVMLKSQYGCDSLVHLSLFVDGRDIDVKWTSISGGVVDYLNGERWERKFCASDEYFVNYRIRSGVPDSFKISFDHEGIAQGFKNVYGRLESADSIGHISFIVPDGIEAGRYKVYVQLFGEGKASDLVSVPISIGLDYRRVTRMWNDVVVFDNSDREFISYQWKRDNEDIPNANGQYYCEYTGLNGFYSLDAVTANHDTLYVCGRYFEPLELEFAVSSYPVYTTSGKVFVYVKGLSQEELQKARMYVYTLEGVLTYWTDIVQKENEVHVREGRYVCVVITEDQRSASCRFVSHAVELK